MNRFQQVLATGLAFGLFTSVAGAQQAPPSPGAPRPFQLPTPQTITLPNGIAATFIDFGVVPKVTIAISVAISG